MRAFIRLFVLSLLVLFSAQPITAECISIEPGILTIIAANGSSTSTTPPLVNVNVVYAGGQSNFAGLGQIYALDTSYTHPFPQVQIWNPFTLQFESLQVGVNELGLDSIILAQLGAPGYSDGFGPEIGFAKAWTVAHPSGDTVYLIKYGTNVAPTSSQGSSIAVWNSTLYPVYKIEIALAHEWLYAHGKRPVASAMLWCEGESETNNSNYPTDLATIVSAKFRTDFLGDTAKFVIIKTGDGTIRSQQVDYYNAHTSNTRLVETSSYLSISGNPNVAGTIEGTHYNCAAQKLIGAATEGVMFP